MPVGWTRRRLPITVKPLDGEALDSWIEAHARRLRVCSSDLLSHIGLRAARLAKMVMLLTGPERDILAEATGIDPQRLAVMTLRRFDGIAVSIDPTRRSLSHPPAWRRQAGSRFCPACLRDTSGRWQLAWRLPWSFACPTHHCLLVDRCPRCRRRPMPHRYGVGEATTSSTCTAPAPTSSRGWQGVPCGNDLASINATPLPAHGPVLAAHRHIHDLIVGAATHPDRYDTGRRSLVELHTLAYKSLAALHHTASDMPEPVARVIAQCGGTIPAPRGPLDSFDAHTIAVASTIAATAHRGRLAGDTTLAWIIHSDRRRRPRTPQPEPAVLLRPWSQASPNLTARILAALDTHLNARGRLAYGTAEPALHRPGARQANATRRAACLPGLLWPAWSMRLIPAKVSPAGLEGARAALAALILIADTRITYRQALTQLGSYAPRNAALRA